jgi:hypothetical protein
MTVGARASTEGADYASASLIAIAKPWSSKELIERASPQLLKVSPPAKLEAFIGFINARLGSLKTPGALQTGPWQVFAGTQGLQVTTTHFADCEFEKGPGRVSFQLVRRRGVWAIEGFHVNADALMR